DEPLAQFGCQAPRGRDAQLTGVRARACRDVRQGRGSRLRQANGHEVSIERRQRCLTDPAQDNVLFRCGAGASAIVAPGDLRQGPHLRRGDVAQRETDSDHGIAWLPLLIDITLEPGLKPLRMWAWTEEATGLRGLVV